MDKYLLVEQLLNEIATGNPSKGPFYGLASGFEGIFKKEYEYQVEQFIELLQEVLESKNRHDD